ncbi:MAG TPA: glycosyltransferase family 39 protein [Chloroflexota bacterium]|nr:glycosyltransferase family 39 protein [Chloroflexota bacterium]
MALALVLRCYELPRRGLLYWDEGKFALEGIRLQAAIQALLGSHTPIVAGKAIGTAKPTHALLIAGSYAVFGIHDYAPLLLDALASAGAVVLVFAVARNLFGTAVGLVSAAFLAVAQYDIIYARSALSESDANLLFLAGVAVWLRSPHPPRSRGLQAGFPSRHIRPKAALPLPPNAAPFGPTTPATPLPTLALAALLLGISFTTNYRLVVYIATLVLVDLIRRLRTANARETVKRALTWIAGLAAAPLAWMLLDAVTRRHGLVLFRNELTGRPSSYLSEVMYQIHQGKQSAINFDPLSYPGWFVQRQGWPMFGLLALGLGLTAGARSFRWLAPAALVVIPYLIYVFAPVTVPRNLDTAIPFTTILCAAGLVEVASVLRATRLRVFVAGGITLALVVAGSLMSWPLSGERSGYAAAAGYVETQGSGRALVSSELLVFYLRGSGRSCMAAPLRNGLRRLAADIQAGYRFAVLDHYSWSLSRYVRDTMAVAVRYPVAGNTLGTRLIYDEQYPRKAQTTITTVTVYRLTAAHLPPPGSARPDVCDRERV